MAGHSKWSQIKRKKGATDAKRGKLFTKLIREITVAARMGGGDVQGNPRLRTAIAAARHQNMPNDNIERAMKRGTGELAGVSYEELTYEGYGPGGTAVIIDVMTDNKQRTVSEIRHCFSKYNGHLGENGCVAWNFETKGFLAVSKDMVTEEKLMSLALEAGAEDIREEGKNFEITTAPKDFEKVKEGLESSGIKFALAEIAKLPKTLVQIKGKDAEQMMKLVEAFEDNDDVQNVYTNSDIPDEVIDKLGNE